MGHCGDRVAALMDGELSHEARERMLRHLAQCDECRAETEALRRTKALVFSLTEPTPPPSLLAGLMRIAEPPPPTPQDPTPHDSTLHHPTPPDAPWHPDGSGPTIRATASHPEGELGTSLASHQRVSVRTFTAFSVVILVFGSAFVLAVLPGPSGNTRITPPFQHELIDHVVSGVQAPLNGADDSNAVVDRVRTTAPTAPTGHDMNAPVSGGKPTATPDLAGAVSSGSRDQPVAPGLDAVAATPTTGRTPQLMGTDGR